MDLCQSRERADAILVSAAVEDKWRDADISLRFRLGQRDGCLVLGVLCLFLCAGECVCISLSHTHIAPIQIFYVCVLTLLLPVTVSNSPSFTSLAQCYNVCLPSLSLYIVLPVDIVGDVQNHRYAGFNLFPPYRFLSNTTSLLQNSLSV